MLALDQGATFPRGLSAAQLEHYWREGYVVLERFFAPSAIVAWNERFLDIVERRHDVPEDMLVMRDVMVAKGVVSATGARAIAKIQDLESDSTLFGYSRDERLLDMVESVVGPDIRSVHTMVVNKPPGVDGRHPLHQDQFYFPFGPAESIVGAWTPLGRCHRLNGCMFVVPGSHRKGLLEHGMPEWSMVNGKYFGVRDISQLEQGVHLEMEAGDLLLFHPLLVHGTGRNRTSDFRRAISTHYSSTRCVDSGGVHPLGDRRYVTLRGTLARSRNR